MILPVVTRPRSPASEPRRNSGAAPAPAPRVAPSTPPDPDIHLHVEAIELRDFGPLTPSLVEAGLRDGLARWPAAGRAALVSAPPNPATDLAASIRLGAAPSAYAIGLGLATAVLDALHPDRSR